MLITNFFVFLKIRTEQDKELQKLLQAHADKSYLLCHGGGRYHIETSPLICSANQWTGFYMISASVMKELSYKHVKQKEISRITINKILLRSCIHMLVLLELMKQSSSRKGR